MAALLLYISDYQLYKLLCIDAHYMLDHRINLLTSPKIYFFMWPEFVI